MARIFYCEILITSVRTTLLSEVKSQIAQTDNCVCRRCEFAFVPLCLCDVMFCIARSYRLFAFWRAWSCIWLLGKYCLSCRCRWYTRHPSVRFLSKLRSHITMVFQSTVLRNIFVRVKPSVLVHVPCICLLYTSDAADE